jgi:hypothetical protein
MFNPKGVTGDSPGQRPGVSHGIVVPGRCPGLFHYVPLGRKTGASGDAWLPSGLNRRSSRVGVVQPQRGDR